MNPYNIIAILESVKLNEKRIPIHPNHFRLIEGAPNLYFQQFYAKNFNPSDNEFEESSFHYRPRDELLENADVIFLLKPTIDDLAKMKPGAIVIGWCHAIQQIEIAQTAQNKKLTLIAMEAMFKNVRGKKEHLFCNNNFMAGKISVEHALSSIPFKYPKDAKIAVITYGAVGQGAVHGFKELGFNHLTVFSRRPEAIIENKFSEVTYIAFLAKKDELFTASGERLKKSLLEFDIIVNAIMQDVIYPYQFLLREDLTHVKNKYIIDISCDDKMGFDFAMPTTISNPTLQIEHNFYYAVENIPSICWQTVSISISETLAPLVKAFSSNCFSKEIEGMLKAATEIKQGEIINKTINEYQRKLRGF